MSLRSKFTGLLSAVILACSCSGPAMAQETWQPVRPIQLVLMDEEGGGTDRAARLIYSLIVKYRLANVPFYFVHKSGNSGMDGLMHLVAADDPDHTILLTSNGFFTAPIRKNRMGIDVVRLTPIAQLGEEPLILTVSAKKKDIKNLREFSDRVQEKPRWMMAGAVEDGQEDFMAEFLNAAFETKAVYAAVGSGEVSAMMVASGVADSAITTVSEQRDLILAGLTKPIVTFSEKRIPEFPDVPALRETSWDISNVVSRSFAGAATMSGQSRTYYIAMLKKVYETPEWQQFRRDNSMGGEFVSGGDLREVWKKRLKSNYLMMAMTILIRG